MCSHLVDKGYSKCLCNFHITYNNKFIKSSFNEKIENSLVLIKCINDKKQMIIYN